MAVNFVYQLGTDNVAGLVLPVVQGGTEDTLYTSVNLSDGNPAKPAKLTSTSGFWRWSYVSKQRVDLVSIIHSNLDAGLNVRVQGNDTDVWTSPTFDQAITIAGATEDLYPINAGLDLTPLSGYTTAGFFHWRVGTASANSAAISVGEIWLGKQKRSFSPNVDWGIKETTERKTVEHETDFGVINTYDLGVVVRRIKAHLDTTDAGRALFNTLWRSTQGRVKPFIIQPFGDGTEPMLVKFDKTMKDIDFNFIDRNEIVLEFVELGRGLRP